MVMGVVGQQDIATLEPQVCLRCRGDPRGLRLDDHVNKTLAGVRVWELYIYFIIFVQCE